MRLNKAFIPLLWLVVVGLVIVLIGGKTYLNKHIPSTPSATPSQNITPSQIIRQDLSSYPDEPIVFENNKPISVQTLIFHRSALRLKTIYVHAIVVDIQKGWCPGQGMGLRCSGPHLTIADSVDSNRDRNLDISFELQILGNQPIPYTINQEVILPVIVYASKSSVNLQIVTTPTSSPNSCIGKVCTSNSDCRVGLNSQFAGCWYQFPRGPWAGIPGSASQPGRCWLCAAMQ